MSWISSNTCGHISYMYVDIDVLLVQTIANYRFKMMRCSQGSKIEALWVWVIYSLAYQILSWRTRWQTHDTQLPYLCGRGWCRTAGVYTTVRVDIAHHVTSNSAHAYGAGASWPDVAFCVGPWVWCDSWIMERASVFNFLRTASSLRHNVSRTLNGPRPPLCKI